MSVAHPGILAFAVVFAMLLLPWLGRTFFGNRDQFLEDIGLADRTDFPQLIVDLLWLYWFFPGRGIWLNVLWFFISFGVVVVVTYNVVAVFAEALA